MRKGRDWRFLGDSKGVDINRGGGGRRARGVGRISIGSDSFAAEVLFNNGPQEKPMTTDDRDDSETCKSEGLGGDIDAWIPETGEDWKRAENAKAWDWFSLVSALCVPSMSIMGPLYVN